MRCTTSAEPSASRRSFSVTAVSDGILNSNHDVILAIDKEESARLTGVPYGQPLPLDVNSFLIRHRGKLILSDAGSGHTMQPTLGKLPENLRALGAGPDKIDIIMLTHLHSERKLRRCSRLSFRTQVDPAGRVAMRCPRARCACSFSPLPARTRGSQSIHRTRSTARPTTV